MANKITYEYFHENMTWPWKIFGVHLDDVVSLRNFYAQLMTETTSVAEMKHVADQFRWLASDARHALDLVPESAHRRIVRALEKGSALEELAPITLPHIMLYARIVAGEFNLPEFPAACQYVASRLKDK